MFIVMKFECLLTHAASGQGTGSNTINVGSNVGHSNPVRSPDGKYIAFTVVYSQTATGNSPAGCQPFDVVPSDGQSIAIDGISDPDSMKFKVTALAGSPVDADACFRWTSWIATP